MINRIFSGAFGGGAARRIREIVHKGRLGIGGEKIHINEKQEKKIIDAAVKVYGKTGSIRGDDFQRNVTNALTMKHVLGSKEASEVEKSLGLDKKYTRQVGYKYFDSLKRDKALANQNQSDIIAEAASKVNKFEKSENRFSRLGKLMGSMKDNRFGENGNSSGEMIFDKLSGRMIHKTPEQNARDSHHGEIPAHGTPSDRGVTPSSDIDA